MADRLSLTRALEGSGMHSDVADRVATEIYDAIHNNVATKADIAAVRADLKADIAAVRADLQADIAAVRADLQTMEQRLDHKIDTMVNRLVAAIVVAIGILFAALHYWPPHP